MWVKTYHNVSVFPTLKQEEKDELEIQKLLF